MILLKCPKCGWTQRLVGVLEGLYHFHKSHPDTHPFTCWCHTEMSLVCIIPPVEERRVRNCFEGCIGVLYRSSCVYGLERASAIMRMHEIGPGSFTVNPETGETDIRTRMDKIISEWCKNNPCDMHFTLKELIDALQNGVI